MHTRLMRFPVLCLLALMVWACPKEEATHEQLTQALAGCWTHAYEEEEANGPKFYRPCDYREFPPSRFRDFFDLAQDGSCEFAQLAANDAHGTQTGSWEYDASGQLIIIRSQEGNVVRRLIIENAAEDLLMIRE